MVAASRVTKIGSKLKGQGHVVLKKVTVARRLRIVLLLPPWDCASIGLHVSSWYLILLYLAGVLRAYRWCRLYSIRAIAVWYSSDICRRADRPL